MAFGPPPTKKLIANTTSDDQNWRSYINAEENARNMWQNKWGWILNEYSVLRENLKTISESTLLTLPKKKLQLQTRNVKPYPETVNREIGWISTNHDFKLEKYGPDVYKGMPFRHLGS